MKVESFPFSTFHFPLKTAGRLRCLSRSQRSLQGRLWGLLGVFGALAVRQVDSVVELERVPLR